MILVTVGSSMFPFFRMTTLVAQLAHTITAHEPIIFQYGHAAPDFLDRHTRAYAFLPHRMLLAHIRQARLIICHGGPATIYEALSFGKIPWVLPREARYGEHLNNHQVDFADFMAGHRLIHRITPKTPLTGIYKTRTNIAPIRTTNRQLIGYLTDLVEKTVPPENN
jgi:UDP-N-acetylglucosamine transferase subunit ALG13